MSRGSKKVAALSYKEGMKAPTVIAKGSGFVAENILKEGRKQDIPVYKDETLAKLLNEIEVGEYIPEALYEVVAQVLVFVSDMDELYEKVKK